MFCRECEIDFPETKEHWHVGKHIKSGFRQPCKECRNKILRDTRVYDPVKNKYYYNKYILKHRQRYKDTPYDPLKNKEKHIMRNYGITLEEFFTLLESQNNVCAICGENPERIVKGTIAYLDIDHNHETGKVRGLLCSKCNIALGGFKEDKKLLLKAVKYLESEQV